MLPPAARTGNSLIRHLAKCENSDVSEWLKFKSFRTSCCDNSGDSFSDNAVVFQEHQDLLRTSPSRLNGVAHGAGQVRDLLRADQCCSGSWGGSIAVAS